MEFHHAGIATDDAAALSDTFGTLLGASVVHEETLDDLAVTFLALGPDGEDGTAGTYFELLEPTGEGTVARYLEREGPGIHHLAVATADLAGAIATAESAGVVPIDETPRAGARGHDVAFLHPDSTGGVLLELVEA